MREFVSEFQSAAGESGWNDAALITAFHNGFNRDIGRELAIRGESTTLDEAIKSAIKVSDYLSLWGNESVPSSTFRSGPRMHRGLQRDMADTHDIPQKMPGSSGPEPMQIDHIHLSTDERPR